MAILQHPGATNQGFQSLILKEGYDTYFVYSMGFLIKKFAEKYSSGSTFLEISGKKLGMMEASIPSEQEQTKIGELFKNLDTLINQHQTRVAQLANVKKSMLDKMFPKAGADVPEVRFVGFDASWGGSFLSELADVYDGTHQTPKYRESGVMFLSVEDIKTLRSNKYISIDDFRNDFKVFPEKGDVIMTRIGDIGTTNRIESDEPIAYYVTLALIKSKKLDTTFLKECIQSNTVQKDIWKKTLHIAFPKKINKNEIEKIGIPFPVELNEQTKIGQFFKNLDTLIAQNQKTLDQLKNLKQALLHKMFV